MDNFTQVHESSSGVPRLDVLINSPHRLQVRHVHRWHKFAGHVRRGQKQGSCKSCRRATESRRQSEDGRPLIKENAGQPDTRPTQSGERVSQGLIGAGKQHGLIRR